MKIMRSLKYSLLICFLSALIAGCNYVVTVKEVGPSGRMLYEDTFVFSEGLSAQTVNFLGDHLLRPKMQFSPEQFISELESLCKETPSASAT